MNLILKTAHTVLANGGWLIIIVILAGLASLIIRHTKTKRDDQIFEYVKMGVKFAYTVMPKNSSIDWVKFTANALGKVVEVWTKQEKQVLNQTTYKEISDIIKTAATTDEWKKIINEVSKVDPK